MIKLGIVQTLSCGRRTEHGVYLESMDNDEKSKVLLPRNQITDKMLDGSLVEVFVYRDSDQRPVATTTMPYITLGKFAVLTVKEVNAIGAFLDWGLPKDLFMPYKEMKREVKAGDRVFVGLYLDKSERLCATSRVYDRLAINPPVKAGDTVNGTIFDYNPRLGAFVAIDNAYLGLLPMQRPETIPSKITCKVQKIREDGKTSLAIRQDAYIQMDDDKELILKKLKENGGFLPYHDKSSPEDIVNEFGFGKNAFKRAIGRLYKDQVIVIENDGIRIK